MLKKIKDFFFKLLAKPLINEGGDLLEVELRKLATANPKLFKTLVVSCHTAASQYGPSLVVSTATDLDDKALSEFLEALEKVALEYGINLSVEAEALKEN